MTTPINLNKARKTRAKKEARAKADANAVKFGRTKAQRKADESESLRQETVLDGLRREQKHSSDKPEN